MGCSKGLVAVAAAVLLMPISAILVRHSKRHPSSDRDYLSLTVNLCIELVKCALSLLLYLAFRRSMSDTNDVNLPAVSSRAAADLEEEEDDDGRASCASSAWRQLRGSLPYAVPAFLYLIDNNVFFLVMRLINPATYHLMSNIKVIFVALLFRFALRRAINRIQWVALVLLVVGLVVSELDALHAMEAAAAISAVNATCATLAPVASAVGLALLPPLTDNSASDSRKSTPPSFAVNQGVRPPIDAAPQWLVAMGRKFDFGEPRSKPFPHSHAISSTDPVGAVSHLSNTRPAQIVALPVYVPLRPPTLSRSSSSSPTSSPAAASSSPPPPVPPLHATTTAELSLAFALVCAMCVCSSIANIAIEHLYKSRAQNVLLQNVQLYAWGAAFNAACLLLRDADTIARDGAFVGFTPIVWAIVFSSALVGLSVAFILKCVNGGQNACLICDGWRRCWNRD